MSIKIIHIINDSPFINMLYRVFEEAYPNSNEYFMVGGYKQLKHIKHLEPKVISKYSLISKNYIKKLFEADIVVFHSLDSWNLQIINSLPNHVKTIWIGWGFDYYDLIDRPLLKPKTALISQSLVAENKMSLKPKIKNLILPSKSKVINKFDIFSPVIYEDYNLVKSSLPSFSPSYVSWNYGTLEDDLVKDFKGKKITGNNILLGNSATFTNNHLDAFDFLGKVRLSNRKIVTPLSYGDSSYKNLIKDEGYEKFGDNFEPLIDFMPIDEYIEKIQSCSVVIMNHLRQQAVGNIITALYLGSKVFLDDKNPVYSFLSNAGAYIYSLKDFESELDIPLTDSQIEKNRQVLSSYWGRHVILDKTVNLIETALTISK